MTLLIRAPFADMGLTPELLVFILVVAIVGAFLIAAALGAVAILIVGPRRPGAAILPGLAGGSVMVAIALGVVLRPDGIPWPLVGGFVGALGAAVLQRAFLSGDTAGAVESLGPRWWTVGGALAGAGLGLVVGAVGAILIRDGWVVPGLVIVGAVAGALGARSRRDEPPAA